MSNASLTHAPAMKGRKSFTTGKRRRAILLRPLDLPSPEDMPQRKLPTLQPAPPEGKSLPTPTDERKSGSLARSSSHARKRAGVNVNGACEPCRKGKRRCDGNKPICGACVKRDITHNRCVYDQLEGLSRSETLKHNAKTLKDELDILRTFMKDLLSAAPGTTIEDLLRLTEDQGISITEALGDDIKHIITRRLSIPGQAVAGPNEGGVLTPILSATGSQSSPSSPDFDEVFDRPLYGASVSPTEATDGSFADDSVNPLARVPSNCHSIRRPSLSANRARTVQNEISMHRHQALVDLCERMAEESQRHYSTQKYQEEEPTNTIHVGNHVQVYAHMPMSSSIRANGYPSTIQDLQILNFQVPLYMVVPLSLADNSPLSRTIIGFLELARARVTQGWPIADILGPDDFDVSRLVADGHGYNPNFDDFSVPGWATSVMMTFPDANMVLRLAGVMQLSKIMKWLISPTPENYALLSESQRPTPAQRMVPHKSEYDFLIVPAARDALIARPREYMQPMLDWLRCDWPAEAPYAQVDPMTNSLKIMPAFEQHVMSADNWYFDPQILEIFPEFEGICTIRDVS